VKHKETYGSAVITVLVAMIVILPFLAYLQYTWLGQISEQEYERMKGSLENAAFHSSMDFSREITNLMKSLSGPLSGSDENLKKIIGERIARWKAASTYPELVSGNPLIGTFLESGQVIPISIGEESTLLLFKNLSAIILPINDRTRQIIIPLNREYISSLILPKIIETNFTQNTRAEYDIVISDESGNLIYNSVDSSKQGILGRADVVVPFLIFPPKPLSPKPPTRSARENLHPDREPPHDEFGNDFQDRPRGRDIPPPPGNMWPGRYEKGMHGQELFEMRLKHRDGSLELTIAKNRLRNLGISFGVLILLGLSIMSLLITTNRARWLAQQQLEFVASVSHELRTPLAVLKSAGENLADGVIREKDRTRKYGDLIKTEVVRLSQMVEKALAYAGIQSGKQNYEYRRLEIAPIINEAVQSTRKLLPAVESSIEKNIANDLPMINGDPAALQSALENLIINGIKYSPEKKWVRIEANKTESKNYSLVEIRIIDHGIGISNSEISSIFKPFYRGRKAVDGQIQGSGLGLSITKHIIESHGGTISAKSTTGEGSVFTIRLPAIKDDSKI
jgi:signal transduction histidine kinase